MEKIPSKYMNLISPLIMAAKGFLESGLDLVPVAFLISLDGQEITQVVLATNTPEEKNQTADTIRNMARLMDAECIFMITEAWLLKPSKSKNYKEILERYGSISKTPKSYREDIVSFTLETREGVWSAYEKIKPLGSSKKKRTINEPSFKKAKVMEGRFIGLLSVKDKDSH